MLEPASKPWARCGSAACIALYIVAPSLERAIRKKKGHWFNNVFQVETSVTLQVQPHVGRNNRRDQMRRAIILAKRPHGFIVACGMRICRHNAPRRASTYRLLQVPVPRTGPYVLQELDLPFSRSRTVPTQSSPKTWKSLQYVTQCTCPLTVRARRL
jgi:hypothetical protein